MGASPGKRSRPDKIRAAFIVLAYSALCAAFVVLTWPRPTALDRIRQTGGITVITRNNANCYYIYRDTPMGFEYDLAKAFAKEIGVGLKVHLADTWPTMVRALQANPDAFVAASQAITPARRRQVLFTNGYMTIRQHVIVNRNNLAIKSARDLDGQKVHVRQGSAYQERLEALTDQGIRVEIIPVAGIPTAELIRMVSRGDIPITIADSHIALLNRRYYPRAVLGPAIGEASELGWAVHPEAPELVQAINAFFRRIKKDGTYQRLYDRYYANVDSFDYVDLRTFHRRIRTRLPRYRPIIEKAARDNGFDWRLIAAQIYQESHFNPRAQSHAGALGLMQLTDRTARSLSVKDPFDPAQNIPAGVRHLEALYDRFAQARPRDRIKIALAAYNIGQGHMLDARKLARKQGLDPDRWASLAKTLPLFKYRKYYEKARYGYFRGTEPVVYVQKIFLYWDILKHQSLAAKRRSAGVPNVVPSRSVANR